LLRFIVDNGLIKDYIIGVRLFGVAENIGNQKRGGLFHVKHKSKEAEIEQASAVLLCDVGNRGESVRASHRLVSVGVWNRRLIEMKEGEAVWYHSKDGETYPAVVLGFRSVVSSAGSVRRFARIEYDGLLEDRRLTVLLSRLSLREAS